MHEMVALLNNLPGTGYSLADLRTYEEVAAAAIKKVVAISSDSALPPKTTRAPQGRSKTGDHSMNTQQLIAEIDLLPVEERARIVKHLLESLTPDTTGNLAAWIDIAQQRREERK